MTTRFRNGFKRVGSMAAAGLLSVLGMTSANAATSGLQTAAWLGQIEVTAPVLRVAALGTVANLGAMTVTARRTTPVADLGSMTVTARIPHDARVAGHSTVDSTGESDDQRARAPRAVLVQ